MIDRLWGPVPRHIPRRRFSREDPMMAVHFETFASAREVGGEVWNGLAADANPMMEWEYFCALEESGSVGPEKGYFPAHLVLYCDDRPVALAPLYRRDRAWVEFGDGGLIEFLSQLSGLPYQRGLVGAVPFTPVPGYRFLCLGDRSPLEIFALMLDEIDRLCEAQDLSTSRIYFVASRGPALRHLLLQRGYTNLTAGYTLWFNRGYLSFNDYLGSFKSSRRTKIKREIRAIQDAGISFEMLDGREASQSDFLEMHRLYEKTWHKHMGNGLRPFLNGSFFRMLGDSFRHRVSFSVAMRGRRRLAMALFYHKAAELYGRYWGCTEEIPFLHFSSCYYFPIRHAIDRGFQMMDPGFGGEHKLIRGYETVPVHHFIKFHGERKRRVAAAILNRLQQVPGKG